MRSKSPSSPQLWALHQFDNFDKEINECFRCLHLISLMPAEFLIISTILGFVSALMRSLNSRPALSPYWNNLFCASKGHLRPLGYVYAESMAGNFQLLQQDSKIKGTPDVPESPGSLLSPFTLR